MEAPTPTPVTDWFILDKLSLRIKDREIPGMQLIIWLNEVIQKKLTKYSNIPNYWPIVHAGTINGRCITIRGGADWLRTAGRIAYYIPGTAIQCQVNYNRDQDVNTIFPFWIRFPNSPTICYMEHSESSKGKTERLFLLFDNGSRADYPYREMAQQIRIQYKSGYTDSGLAGAMLDKIKTGVCPQQFQNQEKLIDFFNALLVGLEAARNNLCYGTWIMTLQLIKANKMTFQQALDAVWLFKRNNSRQWEGGFFPMATASAGGESMNGRNFTIVNPTSQNIVLAMQNMPQNKWTQAIALKEMLLIVKWLEAAGIRTSELMSYNAEKAIKDLFSIVLTEFYPEPS